MCVSTGAPASSKTLVQDISYPVVYVDSAILIRFPKEKTKWTDISVIQNKQVKRKKLYHDQLWIILFICSYKVWLAIASFFVFMILSAWIINRITNNLNSNAGHSQNTLTYWIFYFISVWSLSQGVLLFYLPLLNCYSITLKCFSQVLRWEIDRLHFD